MSSVHNQVALLGWSGISNQGILHSQVPKASLIPLETDTKFIPTPEYNMRDYVTKKRDLNNMCVSQQMLTYAAGKALEDAQMLGETESLAQTDIFVACAIGERTPEVDIQVHEAWQQGDAENIIQQMGNLRPSKLLMELPNLFAANLSIIFGALGESVTFIGETSGAANALEQGISRVACNRSEATIVGGVFNGDQSLVKEYHVLNEKRGQFKDIVFGSASSCLVLGNPESSAATGKPILTELGNIRAEQALGFAQEQGVDAVAVTSELSTVSKLSEQFAGSGIEVLNVSQWVGNVFEASVFTNIAVTLNQYAQELQQGHKILLLCQTMSGEYAAYQLQRQTHK